MPELPEVETIRRGLMQSLLGEKVASIKVLRVESIGYPGVKEFSRALVGHQFVDVRRRGKYLLFDLDGDVGLGVHLRMSGRLLLCDRKKKPGPHLRVCILLESGKELRFEDMRVFGRLWYIPPGEEFESIITGLKLLGVEPLSDFTSAHLLEGFKNRSQSIKAALLDQSVVTGIGNIYADESLFCARIHPQRIASNLKIAELNNLVDQIKQVLSQAIERGGTTLRDYADSEGVNGNYQHEAWVYGRVGQSCRVCNATIERIRLVGRSTHFCPKCQRLKSR